VAGGARSGGVAPTFAALEEADRAKRPATRSLRGVFAE
jgi:hypothetical protein